MKKSQRIVWAGFLAVTLFALTAFNAGKAASLREQFFKAFSSGNKEQIDQALAVVGEADGKMARAYEGALLMKKAGLIKGPGEKLKMFKKGHEIFESELAADPGNAELRFIRLCIQENAPKVLKYRHEIEEDKAYVVKSFASLPADIRKHILDYAESSDVLPADELKQKN